ncbi:MAG: sporulation transcriptional regulator SpoIIID [Clostridia bacterium]|nr:sporulation transcriptional regulator SpoIIID [Clostridia bacterium]
MKITSRDRAVMLGEYIVETGATVRKAAKVFNVSKSTVHKDVTDRLKHSVPSLYNEVRIVLQKNKDERHIRGGIATKQKYLLGKKQ